MSVLISEKTIPKLPRPAKGNKLYFYDGKDSVRGFAVRVTAGGAISFVLNYRINQRERRYTIGKYPELSLADARNEASDLRNTINEGNDPLTRRRQMIPKLGKYPCDREDCQALRELLNRPEINDFLAGVKIEAAHQLTRWGIEQDRAKGPEEWFWVIGYLAGKALHAQRAGDDGKFMHHLITAAAVLANWHYFASNPEPKELEQHFHKENHENDRISTARVFKDSRMVNSSFSNSTSLRRRFGSRNRANAKARTPTLKKAE